MNTSVQKFYEKYSFISDDTEKGAPVYFLNRDHFPRKNNYESVS